MVLVCLGLVVLVFVLLFLFLFLLLVLALIDFLLLVVVSIVVFDCVARCMAFVCHMLIVLRVLLTRPALRPFSVSYPAIIKQTNK